MLVFYPLEYISFFSTPSLAPILPITPQQSLRASLWSVRAWGVYVLLQIALLVGELKEIVHKLATGAVDAEGEHGRLAAVKRRRAIMYQLVANVSRLPVILHWCVVSSVFSAVSSS